MITTQNIDKANDEMTYLENSELFKCFEMFVDEKLQIRDREIAKCYKHIKLCLEEINSLKLILKLEEKS